MGPVSAAGLKRKTVLPIFLCGGSQGSADCRDIWCDRAADHALPFPGCLCCAPLSLSCPFLATSLFPGLTPCSVSVSRPLWEKMATTEVETRGWKEVLGLSDALNHLCADPAALGTEMGSVSRSLWCWFSKARVAERVWKAGPWGGERQGVGGEEPRLRGQLWGSCPQGPRAEHRALDAGFGPTATPVQLCRGSQTWPPAVWNCEHGFVPLKLNYRSLNLNFT